MAAEIEVLPDREWLVVKITRTRRTSVKVRSLYLSHDEAAILVAQLAHHLPVVVQGRSGGMGSYDRSQPSVPSQCP